MSSSCPLVFLGVDGGGSSTDFVALGADGARLAGKTGPSTNANSVGAQKAKETLLNGLVECVELVSPSCSLSSVVCIVLGMSGCNSPADSERLKHWVAELFTQRNLAVPEIRCFNDSIIALASGTGGDLHGLVLISGTGMIAYARNSQRANKEKLGQTSNSLEKKLNPEQPHEWICGGNGSLIDLGSGFSIGLAALRVAFQLSDGMAAVEDEEEAGWVAAVLEAAKLQEIEDLVDYLYGDLNWAKVAAFAPLVLSACAAHSATSGKARRAWKIARENADYLITAFQALHKRLGFQGKTPVVFVGGVLGHPVMTALVRAGLEKAAPGLLDFRTSSVDPATAAALIGVGAQSKTQ